MMKPRTDAIDSLTAELLRADAMWWHIYEESFPASEREPHEVILESIRRGVGMAFRSVVRTPAPSENGPCATTGLATTHLLANPPAVFLVYLAVDPGERSGGIGSELLRFAWQCGAEEIRSRGLEPLGLVWEVDRPQADAADAEARRRRVQFFLRNGGQVLSRPYLQPPVDGIAPVPMSLMFRPAEDQSLSDEETLNSLVRAIYFEKYEAINGIDRALLEGLLST